MRVFLTGSTGYIGSAVLDALLRAGHQTTVLVRTPQSATAMASRGAIPILGDLSNLKSYRAAADGFDAYVHTAAASNPQREDVDRQTIDALLRAATEHAVSAGSTAFVYTSAIWVLGSNAQPMTEAAQPNPGPLQRWRVAHEQMVLRAGDGVVNLRTAVVRPGVVYGGCRGIVSDLLKNALNGLIRVIGTGDNHWPLIYDRDLADLYVRVATRPDAVGVFHANDEADETVNALVEGIVSQCKSRPDVRHVPIADGGKKPSAYADAFALDQIVRGPRARQLGWAPTLHSVNANVPRLLEEFRRGQERAA